MQRLDLSLPSLEGRTLFLRGLDGRTELIAEPGDPGAPKRLLEHLLVEPSGAPIRIETLLETWRDRVLAALFEREFGDEIDARATCAMCALGFAFSFTLAPILAAQAKGAAATGLVPDEHGWWKLENGARLRPPRLGDVAAYRDQNSLLAALSEGKIAKKKAEALLDAAAPLLSIGLATECPHCEKSQVVEFEVGSYLIEALAAERPLLIRETHLIASRYGWSHETIMALPRADRRAYAQLIIAERGGAALRRAG